jgi:hypothetical protein
MGSLEIMNRELEKQISPVEVPGTYSTIACLGFYRNWEENGDSVFRMAWQGFKR